MTLCFFFITTLFCRANEKNDTIIFTGELSIDPLCRTSISTNLFSFVTSRSWNLEKRQLTIHTLDLKTNKRADIIVMAPTIMKVLQCPAIALNDSFLLMQDDYDLKWFLFKPVQGEFKFVEEVQFPPGMMAFNAKVITSNLFLFTDIYNHHPLDSVHNTSLAIYNARQRKFLKVIHPEVPCIGLSHFPQNWITNNRRRIAMAEPCGNRIHIYDLTLDLIHTIELPQTDDWINLPNNKIPVETSPAIINPKEFIANFEPGLITFSRIQSIHFADDSLLLISVSMPGSKVSSTKNFVYNVNNNIYLDPERILIPKSGYHLDCKDELTFHIDPYLLFTDGYSISLEEDNYLPDPKLTNEENENRKNIFYENNDPEFIIRISKIEIH